MGNCNCKNNTKNEITEEKLDNKSNKKDSKVIKGLIFISKLIIFLFASVLATIIVIPFSIYMLYKVIFFNNGVDVTGTLLTIGKTISKKNKDDDEEEDEEYTFENEDELVLLDTVE